MVENLKEVSVKIDHRELEFQKANDINTEFSFLDLCIKVLHKCLWQCADSPFSNIRTPFICSNSPAKILYSALLTESLRIARTTIKCNEFGTPKAFPGRTQNEGGSTVVLKWTLSLTVVLSCLKNSLTHHYIHNFFFFFFWLNNYRNNSIFTMV